MGCSTDGWYGMVWWCTMECGDIDVLCGVWRRVFLFGCGCGWGCGLCRCLSVVDCLVGSPLDCVVWYEMSTNWGWIETPTVRMRVTNTSHPTSSIRHPTWNQMHISHYIRNSHQYQHGHQRRHVVQDTYAFHNHDMIWHDTTWDEMRWDDMWWRTSIAWIRLTLVRSVMDDTYMRGV